jgi:hypothetical protein
MGRQYKAMLVSFRVGYGEFGAVFRTISGLWPHLSSTTGVWEPLEGLGLSLFVDIMSNNCKVLS